MKTVQITAAAMKLGLVPELRKDGYRRSGMSFHCVGEECTRVLNLQFNKWNTREEGSFTMNLGISFPALHRLAEGVPFAGLPKEYNCDIRTRIGAIMPAKKDHWWAVGRSTAVEKLAQELRDVWGNCARPWLERNSTLSNAASELEGSKKYFLAAAARLLLGEKDEATHLAQLGYTYFPRAALAHAWARKHGLITQS